MFRKAIVSLVVLAVATPLVAAETFKGRITRIDERTVTLSDINGKDVKTFNLAKDVKVFRMNKDAKEREAIKEGVKAEVFKTIAADKGLNATVTTNTSNEVTEILLTGEKVAATVLPALFSVLAQAPPPPQAPAAPQARPADPRNQQTEQPPAIRLDGQWTVVYAEKDGKKAGDKDYGVVTIKNNVVTCQHEGKERSWRLEFGPMHQIRCTEQVAGRGASSEEQEVAQAGHTDLGVYVASQEYFAVSLNNVPADGRPAAIPPAPPGAVQQRPPQAQPPQAQPPQRPPQQAQPQAQQQPNQPQQAVANGPRGANFVLILKRSGSTNP